MHLLHVAVPLPQSCLASISKNVLLGYWLVNRLANFSSSSSSSFLFIFFMRYTSAIRCDVTLPQKSTPDCKIARKAALAENKKTWTLKHNPDVYGFARLNMTPAQLDTTLQRTLRPWRQTRKFWHSTSTRPLGSQSTTSQNILRCLSFSRRYWSLLWG